MLVRHVLWMLKLVNFHRCPWYLNLTFIISYPPYISIMWQRLLIIPNVHQHNTKTSKFPSPPSPPSPPLPAPPLLSPPVPSPSLPTPSPVLPYPTLPSPTPPLPYPTLPSPPLPPSLSPSLPLVTQQIHCPFQPKQSPSIFIYTGNKIASAFNIRSHPLTVAILFVHSI